MEAIMTQGAVDAVQRGQWLAAIITLVTLGVVAFTGDGALVASVAVRLFSVLTAIFVLGRLPKWWREWRQPSPDNGTSEPNRDNP